MAKKKESEWYKFEVSVSEFLKSLGGNAEIIHDKSIPDKHTGKPRQRDVWIETKVSGVSIKIYVSCKRYADPLDQQQMDGIYGEFVSSGAHKGVIYSYSGFRPDALEKARALDIECFSLMQDEVPKNHIPTEFLIKIFYQRPLIRIRVHNLKGKFPKKLNPLISKNIKNLELKSVKEDTQLESTSFDITHEELTSDIKVDVMLKWEYFIADAKSYLINGAYNFNSKELLGAIASPAIKNGAVELGEEWSKCEKPESVENFVRIISQFDNYDDMVVDIFKN